MDGPPTSPRRSRSASTRRTWRASRCREARTPRRSSSRCSAAPRVSAACEEESFVWGGFQAPLASSPMWRDP